MGDCPAWTQPTFSNFGGTAAVSQGGTGQTTGAAAFNALSPLTSEGDMPYYHSSTNGRLAVGGANTFLTSNGIDPSWGSLTGVGFGTQTASTFLGAPAGSSGSPSFRALVAADLPTITIAGGGTGQTTASAAFNTLSPLSTEGDLLYYHASANTRLAVGGNSQCLLSNGTDPVWGSCSGSSSFAWSSLAVPAANLTLSMSAYTTTFNHTSPVNWTWANTAAATSGTAQSSPLFNLSGAYWTGSASATDSWSLQDAVSSGTNGNSTLTLAHTGSTGTATLSVPNLTNTSTTQYGVLYGGGSSSPIKSTAAGTSGLPLLGQGSAAPTFATLGIAGGGTGQATAGAAFNALSPLTAEGDLHYYHSGSNARLPVGSTGLCLTSNGADPVWGSCSTGSTSATGLGNGTTVIDASLEPGVDFSAKVNAAIAACSPGPCIFDLRGFSGSQTMSENISFPQYAEVYMPQATITRNAGIQFLLTSNIHIHGSQVVNGTIIESANTSTDYSAVFYSSTGVGNIEIDHITIGGTTGSGLRQAVTSVASSSGGNAVYTGTFPNGGSNAYAGLWFEVKGFPKSSDNEGYFLCTASSTTTLTLANPNATAETPASDPKPSVDGTYAVQAGGWAIWAPFQGARLHDLSVDSDLGIGIAPSGCSCYNVLYDLALNTKHGALYLGKGSNSGWFGGDIIATGDDQVNVGFAQATGFGLWINDSTAIEVNSIEFENTKYTAYLNGHEIVISNLQFENDYTWGAMGGLALQVSLPTIHNGSTNITLDTFNPVLDYNTTPGMSNTYGYNGTRNWSYGSWNINKVSNPKSAMAKVGQGSGSTAIQYWAVPVDWNGSLVDSPTSTVGKGVPISLGTVNNQTLGQYTLALSAAAPSGSNTNYTGTIGNCTSATALDGNQFTITGFVNAGNNGTFTVPASGSNCTSTSLTLQNSNGVSESTSASAASDAYDTLSINGQFGVYCYDILKGDTAHYLALCMNPSPLNNFNDDGTLATVSGYSAPSRNTTGDATLAGALSTAENVLDDGSGNITAAGTITAPQFCVGSNCVTSLWSNPLTKLGDLLYGGTSGAATRLPGNTTTTPMYLKSLGASGAATAPTLAQVQFTDIAGTLGIAAGGTGQTSAAAAFNTLSPLTTEGDLPYYHASSNARLAVGTSGQCLTSNGTDPAWGSCGVTGVQVNGTNTSNQATVNFINGTYLTASNPSAGQVKFDITGLPLVDIAGGGTGQTTSSAAFNALSPMTTLGDLEYEGSSGATRLAGNTTATKNFLISTGTGSAAAAPLWGTIATSDLPGSGVTTVGGVACTLGSSCTMTSLNGVSFPASPSTNTVPVVTSSNTITYETVPATALPSTLVYTGQANTYSSGDKQTFGASTSSAASFNTPAGTAPTTPAAGDHWYDGDRIYVKDAETNSGVVSSVPRRFAVTSAVTATSTTPVTVGTFAVAASKTYCLMCTLFMQSNSTSNKPTMLVTCPSSPTASQFGFTYAPSNTTTAQANAGCGTAMAPSSATVTTSATFLNGLSGMLQNGTTAGSLSVQVESSGSYNTVIEPGSYCILY